MSANSDTGVGGCNAGSGDDQIQLSAGATYRLNRDLAAGDENYADQDDLDIRSNIIIYVPPALTGPPPPNATIERDPTLTSIFNQTNAIGEFRIFEVHPGATLKLIQINVRNGFADAASSPEDQGGGIYVHSGATLELEARSSVSGNRAWLTGGGIHNAGGVTRMSVGVISGNQTRASNGGGAGAWNSGDFYLNYSIVESNTTGGLSSGGGLTSTGGLLLLNKTTIFGNSAPSASYGGGIAISGGQLKVFQSTISGNSADYDGGGLFQQGGSAELNFVTIASNSAGGVGGGIRIQIGTLTIKNSIVGNNSAYSAANCSNAATLNSEGVNFATDTSCPSGFTVVSSTGPGGLNLGPLGYYGDVSNLELTPTHDLMVGSAAIDAATDCTFHGPPPNTPTTDQRIVTMPQGTHCDAGSFEFQASNMAAGSTSAPLALSPGSTSSIPFRNL
jgi:hypothetical protein